MITPQQFQDKYLGKTKGYPTDSQYYGECLSLCKLYIKECYGIDPPPSGSNSAYGYWSNFPDPLGSVFTKIPNTVGVVPAPGDIPIWNTKVGAGFGHIDICVNASIKSSKFTGMDQNWSSKVAQLENHTYTNVVGWLHPKVSSTPLPMPNDDLQKILTHYNVKTADELITVTDQQLQFLKDERAKTDALNATLTTTNNEHKDFVSKIITLVNSFGNPTGLSDENLAVQGVTELVSSNSQAEQALKDQQKLSDKLLRQAAEKEKELTTQIDQLTSKANDLAKQVLDLQNQIDKVKLNQQTQQKQTAQISAFQAFVTKLVNTFGGK